MSRYMERLIVVDNYGNRLYELFEDVAAISGFDYTLRQLIRGEEARDIVEKVEALKWCNKPPVKA